MAKSVFLPARNHDAHKMAIRVSFWNCPQSSAACMGASSFGQGAAGSVTSRAASHLKAAHAEKAEPVQTEQRRPLQLRVQKGFGKLVLLVQVPISPITRATAIDAVCSNWDRDEFSTKQLVGLWPSQGLSVMAVFEMCRPAFRVDSCSTCQ